MVPFRDGHQPSGPTVDLAQARPPQEPTSARRPGDEPILTVWRCPKCGRILARLRLTPGACVEIKCAVCNTLATKEAA